ncbi:MAG: GNAT family N-acetyltransferase, partial [Nocardioidaceae bacterium]
MTLAAAVSPTRADVNNVVQRQPSLGKITTRPSLPADAEFMLELYAATHEEELAELGWSLTENRSFVIMQAQSEEWKLGRRYPGMDHVTIGIDGTSIGRLLVCMREEVLHVVDLSLMPRFRGQGVGTQLMREIIGEAREEGVPIKIRVLKDSRSFQFVSRLGFDEPLDFGLHVEVTWTPPAVADPDARTRRGARVRVPEQPASELRGAAKESVVDEVAAAPDADLAPEVALLTEEEAWAMLRDGEADATKADEAATHEPEFAAFVEPAPAPVAVVEDLVEDLPVAEVVAEDLPVVVDVVEDLPVVEDVVEDLPVAEVVAEDLPVVVDLVEDLPVAEVVAEDLPVVVDLVE